MIETTTTTTIETPERTETDRQREEKIFRENTPLVLWFLYRRNRRTGERVIDEDAFQECSIALLRAIRTWNPERSKFGSYAIMCMETRFRQLHYLSRRDCRRIHAGAMISLNSPVGDGEDEAGDLIPEDRYPGPEERALERAEVRRLLDTLALTNTERKALILTAHGLSLRAAGKRMGISGERVRQLQARAIMKIRRAERIAIPAE